jgi:hypothetical protein
MRLADPASVIAAFARHSAVIRLTRPARRLADLDAPVRDLKFSQVSSALRSCARDRHPRRGVRWPRHRAIRRNSLFQELTAGRVEPAEAPNPDRRGRLASRTILDRRELLGERRGTGGRDVRPTAKPRGVHFRRVPDRSVAGAFVRGSRVPVARVLLNEPPMPWTERRKTNFSQPSSAFAFARDDRPGSSAAVST